MLEIEKQQYDVEDLSAKEKSNESFKAMLDSSEMNGRLIMTTTFQNNKPKVTNFELFVTGPSDKVEGLAMVIQALFENKIN